MTCLFCRCNTWASKHRPATIKSKQQTVPCPIKYSGVGGWGAHIICPSKFFSLQPSNVITSQTNKFLNFTIATLTIPPPPSLRFCQLACQLLPPHSFIHFVRLLIQRGRGLPPWRLVVRRTADLPSTQVTLVGWKKRFKKMGSVLQQWTPSE